MQMQQATTRVAEIRVEPNGIIRGTYIASEETLEDAQTNMQAVYRLNREKPAFLLIDSRQLNQMTPEVRRYYTSDAMIPMIRALAILIDSAPSRLFGNIFLRFQNSNVPTKLFTDEMIAITWLKSHMQKRVVR